jgi:hypothetical protein
MQPIRKLPSHNTSHTVLRLELQSLHMTMERGSVRCIQGMIDGYFDFNKQDSSAGMLGHVDSPLDTLFIRMS